MQAWTQIASQASRRVVDSLHSRNDNTLARGWKNHFTAQARIRIRAYRRWENSFKKHKREFEFTFAKGGRKCPTKCKREFEFALAREREKCNCFKQNNTMHRNSQKRYYGDYVYSITCNTQNKFPFFKKKEFCDIFMNVLFNTKSLKKFELYAFCLNYDHFHILLRPDESVANVSQIMQCLKKNVSQDINKLMLENILLSKFPIYVSANSNSRLQEEGENALQNVSANSNSRLQEEGEIISQCRREHRLLRKSARNDNAPTEDGEMFSKNVSANSNSNLQEELENAPQNVSANSNSRLQKEGKKFQRQKSFHDHIIRNEWDFVQHLKYIQFNYLKHDMPEDRKYTSYKNNKLIDYLNINW